MQTLWGVLAVVSTILGFTALIIYFYSGVSERKRQKANQAWFEDFESLVQDARMGQDWERN